MQIYEFDLEKLSQGQSHMIIGFAILINICRILEMMFLALIVWNIWVQNNLTLKKVGQDQWSNDILICYIQHISRTQYHAIYEINLQNVGQGQRSYGDWFRHHHKHIYVELKIMFPYIDSFKDI